MIIDDSKDHPEDILLITNSQMSTDHTKFTKEDKIGLFMLTILFMSQGMSLGFFTDAIPILLAANGASYTHIGLYSFCIFPFSFKLFFAPILDSHYSKSFGRRKSYIVPAYYMFGVSMVFFSMYIEGMIDNVNYGLLLCFGLYFMTLTAICGACLNGWAVTLLSPPKVSYGSLCQSIGQTIGGFLGYNLLIPLTSLDFANTVSSEEQETSFVTLSGYCLTWGLYIFTLGFIIHFFKKEKQALDSETSPKLSAILQDIKGFCFNHNLRFYLTVLLTWNIGFSPIGSITNIMLIKRGFPKEVLTSMQTFVVPFHLIIVCITSKIANKKQEMKLFRLGIIIKFFDNIFIFLILQYFDADTNLTSTVVLLYISNLVTTFQASIIFIGKVSFHLRISDPAIGSTFMTVLASFSNFGTMWFDPIVPILMDHVGLTVLCTFGWIYSIAFLLSTWKRLYGLQEKDKREFALDYGRERFVEPTIEMS